MRRCTRSSGAAYFTGIAGEPALGQVVATTISPPAAPILGSVVSEKTASGARRSSGVGMWVTAQRLSKLCEQSGMSMPIRAPLWISAGDDHLLSEEISDQEWYLAFRAVTAQTDGTAKEIALRAATLADEAFHHSSGIRTPCAPRSRGDAGVPGASAGARPGRFGGGVGKRAAGAERAPTAPGWRPGGPCP